MTARRLGTGLFLLLLINSCARLCPGSGGTVSTPGGSGPGSAIARVLAACDSAGKGIGLTVGGMFSDLGGEHEVTATARLVNPTGTTISWTTDDGGTPGPLKGASGTGSVVTVRDSTGEWYKVDISMPVTVGRSSGTLTITGQIRKNDNPPPPCTGSGSWSIPGVGQGSWKF